MTVTTGSLSDTATICNYCESVNMSVAYEAPHTAMEHTDWRRLEEICSYVELLITDFTHYPTPVNVYNKSKTYNDKDYWKEWRNKYGYGE